MIPKKQTRATPSLLKKTLNQACQKFGPLQLENTAVVYVHHPLHSALNFIESLLDLGLKAHNLYTIGKRYAVCDEVITQIQALGVHYQPCSMQIGLGTYSKSFTQDINWLWARLLQTLSPEVRKILVLDHGGYAISYLPPELLSRYEVIAVEKTISGLQKVEELGLPPFPLIAVASSAAKTHLEAPLVAEAVLQKSMNYFSLQEGSLNCGVVGFGAIGQAVAEKLSALGHRVLIYDNKKDLHEKMRIRGAAWANELSTLVAYSDYVFGCTGTDISEGLFDLFRLSPTDKTLISCSSEDKEFLSFIKKVDTVPFDPLEDLEYSSVFSAKIRILRGGFPINFDHSGVSLPSMDIQLTRALVFAAVMQALHDFKKPLSHGLHVLDASMQHFIIKEWLSYPQNIGRYPSRLVKQFNDHNWILDESTYF